jgi:hypothetical protein
MRFWEVAVKLAEANALVANVVVEIYVILIRRGVEVAVKLAEANALVANVVVEIYVILFRSCVLKERYY